MPIHTKVGSDADSLTSLVEEVEAAGETIVSVLPAGNAWAVVTAAKRKPAPQTREKTR